jgi:hypothetical protein
MRADQRMVEQKAIGAVEVVVGEVLRAQRTDRQSPAGCGRARVDDAPEQRQEVVALETAGKQSLQAGVIDRREVAVDVDLGKPRKAAQIRLHLRDRLVHPEPWSAGVAGATCCTSRAHHWQCALRVAPDGQPIALQA